jgi:hypothetical protein
MPTKVGDKGPTTNLALSYQFWFHLMAPFEQSANPLAVILD